MISFKEFIIENTDSKSELTSKSAVEAANELLVALKELGYEARKSGANGIRILGSNGCPADIIFDHTL